MTESEAKERDYRVAPQRPAPPGRREPLAWSILIPTMPERADKLARMRAQLDEQIASAGVADQVEYLTLSSERSLGNRNTTGEKRSILIDWSKSEFVSFVDDDDVLRDDYVSSIYEALVGAPLDLVTFDVEVKGRTIQSAIYDLRFKQDGNFPTQVKRPGFYARLPNHLMVWRRALTIPYKAVTFGEDADWAQRMAQRHVPLRWRKIDKVLYEYHIRSAP